MQAPLFLAGNLAGWGVVGAIHPNSLVKAVDTISGASFLIDTGSTYSIIPHSSSSLATGPLLKSANGHKILCWGRRRLTVQFNGRRYTWWFLLAAVDFHIIGVDFLRHFNLLVDVKAGVFTSLSSLGGGPVAAAIQLCSSPSRPTPPPTSHPTVEALELGPPAAQQDLAAPPAVKQGPSSSSQLSTIEAALLSEFADVLNADGRLPPSTHGVEHHIVTSGRPVTAKFRRLDSIKLAAAKEEFQKLEKEGIVRRSDSDWASPLHMVKKSDGSWRPCGDFRRLNLQSDTDCYPLPNMTDITSSLAGATIFSKLDLKKGYHQIPVNPADVRKTAIITPFGLFEFIRMPFGLKNAGMTFQRFMDRVLAGLPFILVYLDDILIASPNREAHLQHLKIVLQRLRDNGLVLNKAKCQFFRSQVEFLGLKVTASGVEPLPEQLSTIRDFPQPGTIKELQGFLGAVNFYRRFIPAAAKILLPLTNELKGGRKGLEQLTWSQHMLKAFNDIKTALNKSVCLAFPTDTAELTLATDASASHVGAVLQQKQAPGSGWRPLGFFSAKLEVAQLSYSAFDRELFAIFSGIRHFRHHLEGRKFTIWTDHKPLTFALSRVSDSWTAKQQRQLSYIVEFTAEITHVPGKLNVVADLLSRPQQAVPAPGPATTANVKVPSGSLAVSQVAGRTAGAKQEVIAAVTAVTGIDLELLAEEQTRCPSIQLLRNSTSLQIQSSPIGQQQLWCDTSSGRRRPLVPTSWQRQVFSALHCLAHPGIRATRRLLSARFVWRGMAADVGRWCKECEACQKAKVTRQPSAPIQPIPVPSRRFTHLHVDLVGPLTASVEGFTHVMTMIDRTTRWMEVCPLSSTTATACADALVASWISRFGVPAIITSDRGVQFTSAVWQVLCKRLGIQHNTTTAYHPQSNGLVERFHRQLKDSMRARLATRDWPAHLPWVLLGLRAAPKEDFNVSAAELLYGVPLSLPGELLDQVEPPAASFIESLRRPPTSLPTRPLAGQVPTDRPPKELAFCQFVFVRRGAPGIPLSPLYDGPYKVLTRGPKYFTIQVGGRQDSVSVDRLKPCLASEVTAAAPPLRGRPPSKK